MAAFTEAPRTANVSGGRRPRRVLQHRGGVTQSKTPCSSILMARMPPAVIENPILNSPFEEPTRHFRFADEGITDEVVEAGHQRLFRPHRHPAQEGGQLQFDTEWTQDRIEENKLVNRIRAPRRHSGARAATRRHPDDRRACSTTGPTPSARRSCSSARSRRSRRPSTSPRPPRSTATPGSRTSFATANDYVEPRLDRAWRSRWPPAPARRSSWRCSSPGRRSTSSPTRRTPASPTPS